MKTFCLSRCSGLLIAVIASVVSIGNVLASSESLIDQAAKDGTISSGEAAIYKALAVVRPEMLPTQFQSEEPSTGKCGTGSILEAFQVMASDPALYRSYANVLGARPSTQFAYQSPQGYFWLHYDTTGQHAVARGDTNSNFIPDYVERAALLADSAWRYQVLQLGHLPPPPDGTLGGGVNQYDIYFQFLGVYGYTSPELPGPNPWNDYSSHVVVHSNFGGFPPNQDPEGNMIGALKVTVAHEFYHSVQFAYDAGESIFFMEQSSTWMEEMIFAEVNDNYNYLPEFFIAPQKGLQNTDGNHEYAAFIWPKFLQENFGAGIMKDIWTECRYGSAVAAWSYVLDTLDTNLPTEFVKFLYWNYHTGDRYVGRSYQAAHDYPQVHVMRYTDVIPDSNEVSIEPPEALASNYIVLNNYSGEHGILTFNFTGIPTVNWGLAYVIDHGSFNYFDSVKTLPYGSGRIYIPHFENVLRVIFIPGVTSTFGSATNYNYHIYWRIPGDMNADDAIDISDAILGINYIFDNGAPPDPLEAMDANCDGTNDISDVTYLIEYIFAGGPPPCR